MTTELWCLVGAAALQWLLILAAAAPRLMLKGMAWGFSNRDQEGRETPEWTKRLARASDNLQENLILFAILVLVVHVSGRSNDTSATGALIFIGARVAHAIIYAAGITVVRTLAWLVGVVGMLMVGLALV
jgi:uncharacterized MAPEG superfamily protein